MKRYLVLGGDQRQLYLSQMLSQSGNAVITHCDKQGAEFSLEQAVNDSEIILCPIPFTKDSVNLFSSYLGDGIKIEYFLSLLTKDHHVFGGNMTPGVRGYLEEHHIPYTDYMGIEEIAILNTIATAEGAIAEAISLSHGCIHQSPCMVTGFGRCGKTLASKLKGLDAHVCVVDRNERQLALAASMGFHTKPMDDLDSNLSSYAYIFNTIPALILHGSLIQCLSPEVTIIDLASAPGGVDFKECSQRNIRAKLCLGLPGIYAPQTSANILYDAIIKNLS